MDQDKLSSLALLFVKNDNTDKLMYEDSITNFIEKKIVTVKI